MLVTGLQRLTALLLALVAILLFPLAVWVGGGINVLLTAETYKDGLADQNMYADIVPVALPAIAEAIHEDGSPEARLSELAQLLPRETWRRVATDLVPPEWLRAETESAIDQFFAWIQGDEQALLHPIDFNRIAERMTGDSAGEAADTILAALPACTPQQAIQLRSPAENADVPLCKPAAEQQTAVVRLTILNIFSQIGAAVRAEPMTLEDFFEEGAADEAAPGHNPMAGLALIRLSAQAYQRIVSLFYLCPAALLALIVIVVVRSLRSFGRWMGWTSIASGIISLLPLVIIPLLIVDMVSLSLASQASGETEINLFLTRLSNGMMLSAFNQFRDPVLMQSTLFILTGMALLVVSSLAGKKLQTAPAESQIPSTASARRTTPLAANSDIQEMSQ